MIAAYMLRCPQSHITVLFQVYRTAHKCSVISFSN